jgi:hypothetical protein
MGDIRCASVSFFEIIMSHGFFCFVCVCAQHALKIGALEVSTFMCTIKTIVAMNFL